jgi:hypothetical protein
VETYILINDLKVFGVQVKDFPQGVAETFHVLINMIPDGNARSYYGIFQMNSTGNMVYCAAAEELHNGEAEQYHCERYTIAKGQYLTEKINDWQKNISRIKDVFTELSRDPRIDQTKPGVEWYKNDKEMVCMLKTIECSLKS